MFFLRKNTIARVKSMSLYDPTLSFFDVYFAKFKVFPLPFVKVLMATWDYAALAPKMVCW